MHHSDSLIARRRFVAIDALLVAFALIAALCYANRMQLSFNLTSILSARLTVQNLLRVSAVFAMWALLMRLFRTYSTAISGAWSESLRIAGAVFATAVLLSFSFDQNHKGASGLHVAGEFALFSMVTMCGVRAIAAFLANYTGPALLGRRRVVIVGTGPRAMRTFRYVRTQLYRSHTLLGFLDTCDKSICAGEIESMFVGSLSLLESFLVDQVVDEVYVALPARSCYQAIEETVEICTKIGVHVKYPDDTFPSALVMQSRHKDSSGLNVVTMRSAAHDERLILKRLFDLVFSLFALIVLSPLLLLIAAIVRSTTPGPALVFHERYGLGRRRFKICKFRTTPIDASSRESENLDDASSTIHGTRNPASLTRIGVLLRRTALDELPQLLNIFAGHMSFVGPRPMSVRDVSHFNEAWLMRRFSVKPGITGLWQVTRRGATSFARWVEMDLQYIDNWSLGLDAKILARTVPAVIKGSEAA